MDIFFYTLTVKISEMPKSYTYNFQLNPAFPFFQVKLGYTLDTFTRVYMDL